MQRATDESTPEENLQTKMIAPVRRFVCSHCLGVNTLRNLCATCKGEVVYDEFECEYSCAGCESYENTQHFKRCVICKENYSHQSYRYAATKIVATIHPQDFDLLCQVAAVNSSNAQANSFTYSTYQDDDCKYFLWHKSAEELLALQFNAAHLMRNSDCLWLDGEKIDALYTIRMIDDLLRQLNSQSSFAVYVWQKDLDSTARNWLAAQFKNLMFGVDPEMLLGIPLFGLRRSSLIKQRVSGERATS